MKLIRLLDRIIEVAAVFAFAVSSILIGINVFNRYVISGGLRNLAKQFESLQPLYLICREWFGSISVLADEVPGLLLVWIAFLGAYLAMRRDGHIAFDLLARRVGAAGQRFLALMNAALIGGFLVLLFFQSIRMIRVSGATEIETAELAQGWFMLIMPLAALLLLLAVSLRLKSQWHGLLPGQLASQSDNTDQAQ